MHDLLDQSNTPRLYTTNIMDRFRHFYIDLLLGVALHVGLTVLFATLFSQDLLRILLSTPWPYVGTLFAYYFFCEWLLNATLGKFINKTRVRGMEGGKPTSFQILLRTIFRFLPITWMSLFLPEKLTMHDIISKTRTVRVPSYTYRFL